MAKSTAVKPKLGRPSTGRSPFIGLRLPQEFINRIDQWADNEETSRSEAIRRLVELGLKTPKRKG